MFGIAITLISLVTFAKDAHESSAIHMQQVPSPVSNIQDTQPFQGSRWLNNVRMLYAQSGATTLDPELNRQQSSNANSERHSEEIIDDSYRPLSKSDGTESIATDNESIPIASSGLSVGYQSPIPVVPSRTRDYAESIVCSDSYRWDCTWVLDLIFCESSYNYTVDTNYPYVGWFQVTHGSYDPIINTQQAYQQWLEWQSGIRRNSPWPNCP